MMMIGHLPHHAEVGLPGLHPPHRGDRWICMMCTHVYIYIYILINNDNNSDNKNIYIYIYTQYYII